jgi:hypothetical protein
MTNQAKVLLEIKNACNPLFSRISEREVSEIDMNDTQLPALIIIKLETVYGKQLDRAAEETYDIKMMILLENKTSEDFCPLSELSEMTKKIIKALLAWQPFSILLNRDGIVLKTSSESNAIKEYVKGNAIWSMLNIICSSVQCYD